MPKKNKIVPTTKNDLVEKIGTVEVITFRSDRESADYGFPIYSIFWGYSTGHIALRFTFNDTQLFEEYIANNPRIPHFISKDRLTGELRYEVYVSFWPNKELAWTNDSILERHQYDCEQSANGSPFDYNPLALIKFNLNPISRVYNSRVPVLSNFLYTSSTIPPSMILHSHRLEFKYGKETREAAEKYCKHYSKWRAALIKQKNDELLNPNIDKNNLSETEKEAIEAKILMMVSEEELSCLMYPHENLSHAQFIYRLEQDFVTFCHPERDSVTLPLIKIRGHRRSDKGLELEPMLRYVRAIADNPSIFAYSLLGWFNHGRNCAHTSYNIIWQGLQSCSEEMQESFRLSSWLRWFSFVPPTPSLILKYAVKLQNYMLNDNKPEEIFRLPRRASIEQTDTLKTVKLKLQINTEILQFTKNPNEEDCEKNQSFIEARERVANLLGLNRSNSL